MRLDRIAYQTNSATNPAIWLDQSGYAKLHAIVSPYTIYRCNYLAGIRWIFLKEARSRAISYVGIGTEIFAAIGG
jgi:hypothetical protein